MISSSGWSRRDRWWLGAILAGGVLSGGGATAQQQLDEELVEAGRLLFLEETFGGNGRTCATCHPPENNFTIDPAFVRSLPGNDPLFVTGPSLPDLKGLEVRQMLLRGLILENVDGFDQPGVLRSVPHTLGLGLSIQQPDQQLRDHVTHATGWSGDGSPGRKADDPNGGSLRNFAIGAVIQHFPKTLNRIPGIDFRLPTDDELDALEAFQLSLGRQEEINLDTLNFADPFVHAGKSLFDRASSRNGNGRGCGGCHNNAGANAGDGTNRNRATGANHLTNAPACLPGFVPPGDGGFDAGPVQEVPRAELCGRGPRAGAKASVAFRGDGTMNTPPLIEAADTPPFFHNNSAETIEDAVRFYTSDTFNNSVAGAGNAFVLSQEEVHKIAALLRTLNALENIRSSNAYVEQALGQLLPRAEESVELAISETTDAIEVLTQGPVGLFPGTDVVALLEQARALERQALGQGLPSTVLEQAIELKETARDLMLE